MNAHSAVTGLALARGDWQAEARAPLLVSDPLKARHLLGLDRTRLSARARHRHEAGVLPFSALMRAIPLLEVEKRRELEGLFSGGDLLWRDEWKNIVVNAGLNYILDAGLSGGTPDTTWFVGLTDGTPTVAAADTLASHAGWVEVTAFDEVNRVGWTDGGVASQSVSNAALPAVFTINVNGTVIGGAFLSGVNTGTAGTLYAAGAFTAGDRTLNDNETLSVTITATAASA